MFQQFLSTFQQQQDEFQLKIKEVLKNKQQKERKSQNILKQYNQIFLQKISQSIKMEESPERQTSSQNADQLLLTNISPLFSNQQNKIDEINRSPVNNKMLETIQENAQQEESLKLNSFNQLKISQNNKMEESPARQSKILNICQPSTPQIHQSIQKEDFRKSQKQNLILDTSHQIDQLKQQEKLSQLINNKQEDKENLQNINQVHKKSSFLNDKDISSIQQINYSKTQQSEQFFENDSQQPLSIFQNIFQNTQQSLKMSSKSSIMQEKSQNYQDPDQYSQNQQNPDQNIQDPVQKLGKMEEEPKFEEDQPFQEIELQQDQINFDFPIPQTISDEQLEVSGFRQLSQKLKSVNVDQLQELQENEQYNEQIQQLELDEIIPIAIANLQQPNFDIFNNKQQSNNFDFFNDKIDFQKPKKIQNEDEYEMTRSSSNVSSPDHSKVFKWVDIPVQKSDKKEFNIFSYNPFANFQFDTNSHFAQKLNFSKPMDQHKQDQLLNSPQKKKSKTKYEKVLYCNGKRVPKWAENLKIVAETQKNQENINPYDIFGRVNVKTIDINEIFETNDSKFNERGSSANWKSVKLSATPNNPLNNTQDASCMKQTLMQKLKMQLSSIKKNLF